MINLNPILYFLFNWDAISYDFILNFLDKSYPNFYNNNYQRYSKELSTITVSDNDRPNVHITLYEYKGQTQVEYSVLSAQGNDPSLSEDSEDVLVFRSKDKRSQIDEFKSESLYEQANNQPVININSIKSGMDFVNQAFHIPEDVRFMIQVEASDNKDLDEEKIKPENDDKKKESAENDKNNEMSVDSGMPNIEDEASESDTWSTYKAQGDGNETEADTNQNAVDQVLAEGRRYGLEPSFSQGNGVFYIDNTRGFLHFSSDLNTKTITLK